MDNKITMQRLSAMLALATGKQKKLCEDFLKEIFKIVTDRISQGDSVKIKGFGTFKLSVVEARKSVNVATGEEYEIPTHNKVMFIAAKELSQLVNSPFEVFEAVEVSDEIPTDEILSEPDDSEMETAESVSESEFYQEVTDESASSEDSLTTESIEEESDEEELAEDASGMAYAENSDKNEYEGNDEAEELTAVEEEYEDPDEEKPVKKSRKFMWGFVAGFVVALLLSCICVLLWIISDMHKVIRQAGMDMASVEKNDAKIAVPTDSLGENNITELKESVSEDDAEQSDNKTDQSAEIGKSENKTVSEESVPTKASDTPVYDTVSTTRYLTTIAKEHYGNFNLWPVIYEANRSILGHPDRIRPGTVVLVPSLSSVGVNPKNAADVKRIKQKGIEIYAKYK